MTSPDTRLCIVCDAPAADEHCATCGSRTFAKDDPELLLMRDEEQTRSAASRDAKWSMIASFLVGLPVFFIATPFVGWIPGIIIAAGAVFGTTQLVAKLSAPKS